MNARRIDIELKAMLVAVVDHFVGIRFGYLNPAFSGAPAAGHRDKHGKTQAPREGADSANIVEVSQKVEFQ